MTGVSIGIIIGYCILHVAATFLADRALLPLDPKPERYRVTRRIWITVYSTLFALPVLGTFLPECPVGFFCQAVGNFFLGFDIYAAGLFLIFCAATFVIRWIRMLFSGKKGGSGYLPHGIFVFVSIIFGLTVGFYGLYHGQHPVVNRIVNEKRADAESGRHLRIALLADLHMSVNSSPEVVKRTVDACNAEEPDVVLVAGDIFTSTYDGLKDPEIYAEVLRGLKAPEGVYAVGGNHDVVEKLFCGFAVAKPETVFRPAEMDAFFSDCGFTMIEDKTVPLRDGVVLAGRYDGEKDGDGTSNRLSPEDLLQDVGRDDLTIVVQHEPGEYDLLAEAGADVVVSGHTHNGQVFPGNLVCALSSDNAYGYEEINGIDTYVTSGVGMFGPPMRIGTDNEVMIIDLYY